MAWLAEKKKEWEQARQEEEQAEKAAERARKAKEEKRQRENDRRRRERAEAKRQHIRSQHVSLTQRARGEYGLALAPPSRSPSPTPSPPIVTPKKNSRIPSEVSLATNSAMPATAEEMRLFRMLLAERNGIDMKSPQPHKKIDAAAPEAVPEAEPEAAPEAAPEAELEVEPADAPEEEPDDEPELEPAQLPVPVPYMPPPPTDHDHQIIPYGHNPWAGMEDSQLTNTAPEYNATDFYEPEELAMMAQTKAAEAAE